MATIKIEALTTWGPPKRIDTRNGPRNLRKGPCTDAFRAAWKADKVACKAAGLGWDKSPSGEMDWNTVVWWMPIEAAAAEDRDAALEASRATDADVDIPCPAGLAYLGYQKAGIAFALRKFGDIA